MLSWVLLSNTGQCWVGLYWAILGNVELGYTEEYWVMLELGLTEQYWVMLELGYTEQY